MKIEHHVSLSVLVSGLLYLFFRSWGISIASLCAGILIDIDHILDYMPEHRSPFDLSRFLDFFYQEKHTKVTLLLHGWEWLLFLGLMAAAADRDQWITGAFIGYGHHIITDHVYSKARFSTYSLLWRWKNDFRSDILFPRNRGYDP